MATKRNAKRSLIAILVSPLISEEPLPTVPAPKPKKTLRHSTAPTAANNARRAQAEARYKEAMGDGWTRKFVIESRLGLTRSASNDALMSYLARGLVERRPVGGTYVRVKGYEWRWIAP